MRHLSRITDPRAVLTSVLAALYAVVDVSTKALAPYLGRRRMTTPRLRLEHTLAEIQARGLDLARFFEFAPDRYLPAIAGGMKLMAEEHQLAAGFVPVNLATAANDGDWVSLKNFRHLTIILFKGVGTASEDPTITLEQATAVAGTGAKALAVITTVYVKQGADLFTIGQFTKVTQAAAATYTNGTLAEEQALVVIELNAEDLDVEGGFDCVRARVADVGTSSQIGAILYLLSGPRYAPPISAIVD